MVEADREHCASRVAVEQEEERRGGEEQATDLKSNNPHLAGGEQATKIHPFSIQTTTGIQRNHQYHDAYIYTQ